MENWKTLLKNDPTDWLLEPGNPSVRYLTLTRLLDEGESGPTAKAARTAIMKEGLVPLILAKRDEGGWNEPGRFYRDKYHGAVWQLIVLAEHLADGGDPRVEAACEELIDQSQEPALSGFSYDTSKSRGGGLASGVIPCLTGNMVFSLIRLGRLEDERVQKAVGWITRFQRFDDGEGGPPAGAPYDRYQMCWGHHSCHMGVVKSLKALAEIPAKQRTPKVRETIKRGCDYLLAHHVFRQSHDLSKISKPGWLRLQFPLMYQTDILEVSLLLARLGYRDERMQEAVDRVIEKQAPDGRWKLEASFNGRFHVDVETKGKPSKWITLRALDLLKSYYG